MNHTLLCRCFPICLALTSCQRPPAPPEDLSPATAAQDSIAAQYLRSRGLDRPEISIELLADQATMAPGDTVRFTLIARNAGSARIQLGAQCGPAMDIRMSDPKGAKVSVLKAQFHDAKISVGFSCELGPYHFAESRDSLVNHLWWKAPGLRGKYVAVAGARGRNGLDDVSQPLWITVR